MKLKVKATASNVRHLIANYFVDYNIINNSQVTNDTYFLVIEKYFIRNSSRASLSVVISESEYGDTMVEAIGSGGGQGWLFKFDWGAAGSFENKIKSILVDNNIPYDVVAN